MRIPWGEELHENRRLYFRRYSVRSNNVWNRNGGGECGHDPSRIVVSFNDSLIHTCIHT
jgi:hypothetical protein